MDQIFLIGAGVVGREIARAFLEKHISIYLVDLDPQRLASTAMDLKKDGYQIGSSEPFSIGGHVVAIGSSAAELQPIEQAKQGIMIESIAEKRDIKRDFLNRASQYFGDSYIYATNTSTLRLSDLESACACPTRFCGMHFFMPIKGRDLVEIVFAPSTDSRTIDRVVQLATQIGKHPLIVQDSPALVVNRMLTPFLNQGLLLLERGADHRDIRQAARRFGMPFSPLEMIDMIGARTAFDAGRVAWQAFSDRIETTPIIPGLVKSGLLGRAVGEGFYEYDSTDGRLLDPDHLNPKAESVIKRYQRTISSWDVETIELHLAIPMMIEAECILRDSIVSGRDKIELSMREGLGYRSNDGFYQYFEKLGAAKITAHRERFGAEWKALR